MTKCKANLEVGFTPIVITTNDKVTTANVLAGVENIADRVEIFPAEQFLAANLHELSGFQSQERRSTIYELVEQYNRIIDAHETDPSLRIKFEQ